MFSIEQDVNYRTRCSQLKAAPMKAYLYTTGVVFAVIAVGHVWEVIDRSRVFVSDGIIVALSTGLVVWAWRLGRTRT